MVLNNFRCDRLMPLHFKRLNSVLSVVHAVDRWCHLLAGRLGAIRLSPEHAPHL